MTERFTSIEGVKAANARAGYHFFEPSAMRFFDSRICPTLYGGRYFVTSEQFHGSNGHSEPRRYSIREAQYDGSIDAVGEFQAFGTRACAVGVIKALLGERS